ncbi:hypothetical protein RN001_014469 [Aquatica leii]|uniref:Transcription elongation factor, mitochondrial n=1 Tax=Aquatica leii TaxID=1421715 RepID=A0AAN7NUK7_9COLE|nr:hypothetical protein RN001_014469 [Aquatica leii]
MFVNNFKLFVIKKCFQLSLRNCAGVLNHGDLSNKFSDEQKKHILDTLNTADADYLSQLGIPLNRVKNIKAWQQKQGSFTTLVDVLEVDGLGTKILEKLCTNITNEVPATINTKNRRQYLSPPLTKELSQNISNAIALHLGPAGISWAKLSRTNQLLNWNFFKFPDFSKKVVPTDTFKLVQTVLSEIPSADLYVFEQSPHRASLVTKQNISHNQHLEVLSMLLALINTSPIHNLDLSKNVTPNLDHCKVQNCVYYLRSNLSARLFRTLMGTERVSSTSAVNHLLEGVNSKEFPCTVKIDESFKDEYLSRNPIGKELLGQALLLIVAFMDICIHKNPASLAMVSRNKKNCQTK